MDNLSELSSYFSKAKYVQEIEYVIGPLAGSPRTREPASELFYKLIETDLRKLCGAPDEWFNLATSAARARNYAAYEVLLRVAIEQHPADVDLRCSWFSFCYGHKTLEDAHAAREELNALGPDATATYWRYWCFNAAFESQYLGNKAEAERLLDRALSAVPPAGLLNVFRQYRTVLIDGRANPSYAEGSQPADHTALVQRVEDKYRDGLRLGIEAGYVLAIDLAKLRRERTLGMRSAEADDVLDEVLDLLDVAERTYTDDGNYPLWDIYREKAVTLMARRRYEDALQIFRSLPDYQLSDSMRVMAQYAANMTGQEFRPAGTQASLGEGTEQAAVTGVRKEVDGLKERVDVLEEVMKRILSALHAAGVVGGSDGD
jgi:tetratricopeptide (TPR) repeat protein